MSAWAFWILVDNKIMTSNQVKFFEHEFSFRTRKLVDQFLSDNSTDILYQHASDVTWAPYSKLHTGNYEKVQYDTMSDVAVLKMMSKENTYARAIQGKWLSDKTALVKVRYNSEFLDSNNERYSRSLNQSRGCESTTL